MHYDLIYRNVIEWPFNYLFIIKRGKFVKKKKETIVNV